MRNRIIGFVTALAAAVGLSWLVAPAPAISTTCDPTGTYCDGGDVFHHSDANYDPPIIVVCDWDKAFWPGGNPKGWSLVEPYAKYVAEGTSSKQDCGIDTDVIWLRNGEELWCVEYPGPDYNAQWYKFFDASGPHKIQDTWNESCTLRTD